VLSEGGDGSLYGPLFVDPAVARAFSDRATLQAILDFEVALARAEASLDVIPDSAVAAIANAANVDAFDIPSLGREAVAAGNIAIPIVRAFTRLVRENDEHAARFVHWGATSQDAIDTGAVLQLAVALRIVDEHLDAVTQSLIALAQRHIATPMVARTLLQHALPTTFGLKAAGWLSAIVRARRRLARAGAHAKTLQFGGAAGTLAALGDRGLDVAQRLAGDLSLAAPDVPWHTHSDRFVDVASAAGIVAGTLGKIARDTSLMMQTEIGEASEPAAPGRGGSSTMPHKRNPVSCAVALAAATRAPHLVATMLAGMTQEHERALGGWQAQWTTLPELISVVSGSARAMNETLAGLDVNVEAMRANLEITHGLVQAEAVTMALGAQIGRAQAHELIEAASKRAMAEHRSLREVLVREPTVRAALSDDDFDRLFDPTHYLGVARQLVTQAITEARS
jgi:3-carboxy-cis,cis-muconate cycloisomerase